MNHLEKILNSIDYIEENLEERISLDKLAENAYLSKFHFHRLFHSVVGESVGDYIRKRRLTESARELRETKEKVVDIALKYQFGSQESFSRAFKRNFGISPTDYRRNQDYVLHFRRINVSKGTQTSTTGTLLRVA